MKAGRELDALVAENVVGWKWLMTHYYSLAGKTEFSRGLYGPPADIDHDSWRLWDGRDCAIVRLPHTPPYSTSIADAWKVVERLRVLYPDGWVSVLLGIGDGCHAYAGTEDREATGNADTAAHAICLAALQAVGAEVPA